MVSFEYNHNNFFIFLIIITLLDFNLHKSGNVYNMIYPVLQDCISSLIKIDKYFLARNCNFSIYFLH